VSHRVLVTGSGGQIGPAVVSALTSLGCEIVALNRTAREVPQATHAIAIESPWRARELETVVRDEKIAAVINLAAAGVRTNPGTDSDLFEANVALPTLLLRAGRGQVKAFVNIGSGAEYLGGIQGSFLDETAPLTLNHAYGLSKAAGGLAGKQAADELGIAFCHLRLFGVFGENEAPHRLLPNLFHTLRRGEIVPLSDGSQIRDWLYETDVAAAISAALFSLLEGRMVSGIYNLGSGRGADVREFASAVAGVLGVSHQLLGFGMIDRRVSEQDVLVADPSRFLEATGWSPAYSLEDGIQAGVSRLAELSSKSRSAPFSSEYPA
jgi:GDP-4-dehydro-6-deoxy-D-mannose reductase